MNHLQTVQGSSSKIGAIEADLETLKKDVVQLTQDVKSYGRAKSYEVTREVKSELKHLKNQGKKALYSVEEHVVAEPTKSLLVAFFSGAFFSLLLRR